jgi:hypothetical protein
VLTLFNDDARKVLVDSMRSHLRFFAGGGLDAWVEGEDGVARVDLHA